ncbi:hypothetical protein EV401DRAFT_2076924 [Pisolithus croceorrhizus]|nr:hypothetical protein EV401DRAFT_2076924 [Pisolithus croceorrhizus]
MPSQPGHTPSPCVPTSLGNLPSKMSQSPAAVLGPYLLSLFYALIGNCAPSQMHHTSIVTTIPGSIPTPANPYDEAECPSSKTSHLDDPMMVAGTSASTSITHNANLEDHAVHQLVDGIPIPDHPGCQALCDLAANTICASLVSYQSQIMIFNMLLSGGAPGSVSGGIDLPEGDLH